MLWRGCVADDEGGLVSWPMPWRSGAVGVEPFDDQPCRLARATTSSLRWPFGSSMTTWRPATIPVTRASGTWRPAGIDDVLGRQSLHRPHGLTVVAELAVVVVLDDHAVGFAVHSTARVRRSATSAGPSGNRCAGQFGTQPVPCAPPPAARPQVRRAGRGPARSRCRSTPEMDHHIFVM